LRRLAVIAIACLAVPGAALADEEAADERAAVGASFEGIGAAVVPGLVVHGTGLWVRGDVETARRLATLEGVGLGIAAVAGGLLAASGGSRRLTTITIPPLIAGGGLFLTTWLADIYGSAGGGRRGAEPRAALPPVDLELGGFGIYDPVFDHVAFTRAAASVRLGRWRIAPELLIAVGDDNQRLRADLGYRFIGDPRGRGTHLDLVGGLRSHRYSDERFATHTAEAQVFGRLELARLGRSLDGAFAQLSSGLGVEVIDYMVPGAATDVSDMLLGGFGFGLYLGDCDSAVSGEVELYYDHRRDELVGGFSPGQQASGFGGYFGAALDLDLGRRWGLVTRLEWGSAALAGAWVRYRMGGDR
jgi:hypothetical protein